jgi:hypothetical protein
LLDPPSYTEENIKTQKLKLKIRKRFFNRGDVVVKEKSREGSIRFHQMEILKK